MDLVGNRVGRAIKSLDALQEVGFTATGIGLTKSSMLGQQIALAPLFAKNKSEVNVSVRVMVGRIRSADFMHERCRHEDAIAVECIALP